MRVTALFMYLFVLCRPFCATGAGTDDSEPLRITGKIGYTFQQHSFLEGGMLIYRDWGRGVFNAPGGFYGAYVGAELQLKKERISLGTEDRW